MFLLGNSALLLALMLAICNLVIGAVALRQISTGRRGPITPERLSDAARRTGIIGFPAVSAAVFALLWAIFTNDFSFAYVLHESNRSLPAAYPWADQGGLYALLCFSISAFVITAILREAVRGAIATHQQTGKNLCSSMLRFARGNTRRYGAFIVHFGIVLMFIGFAGSAFNHSVERELNVGQSIDLGPYHLVAQGYTQNSNDNYTAGHLLIDVYRGGKKQFRLAPEARLYQTSQSVQPVVANHSTPLWDLYVVYAGQNQDSGLPVIKAFLNPLVMWIWIGTGIVIFGTLVALTPNQGQVPGHDLPSQLHNFVRSSPQGGRSSMFALI